MHVNCRYNPATGIYTVPVDGNGIYFFSVYLRTNHKSYARTYVQVEGVRRCVTDTDSDSVGDGTVANSDHDGSTCSFVSNMVAGKLTTAFLCP